MMQHREALQGRPKKCRGGKSATMMYSYAFTLCRRAVIATMDLSAKSLHMLSTDHWLADIKNVMVLRLSESAWETADEVVACTTPMAEWSVGDVASWLAGLGMAGPAAMLSAQGLSDADLLSFESASAFAHDLGTTPFVANKVLRLRDQHRF